MLDLTFGEQVKIILSRKGMTIKELAEKIEERTGKKMSRQNLTQRLGRDNFQEQDMRMIARILDCPFYLNILDENISENTDADSDSDVKPVQAEKHIENVTAEEKKAAASGEALERDITIGELVDIHEELGPVEEEDVFDELEEEVFGIRKIQEPEDGPWEEGVPEESGSSVEAILEEVEAMEREEKVRKQEKESRGIEKEKKAHGWKAYLQRIKRKNVETGESESGETELEEKGYMEDGVEDAESEVYESEAYESDVYEPEESGTEEFEMETIDLDAEEEEESAEAEFVAEERQEEEDTARGDVNPYTGREYATNSVRMHPSRIGYVQVYDRGEHKWTDMTEWAFLGYQERKKALLGKDYEPPIYLD